MKKLEQAIEQLRAISFFEPDFDKHLIAEQHVIKAWDDWNRHPAENEVLTIKEISEMNGLPVYIQENEYPEESGYGVVKSDRITDHADVWQPDNRRYDTRYGYGNDWVCYRRQPEQSGEQKHTK